MLSRERIEDLAREGRGAFERGGDERDCRYVRESAEWLTWMRGFKNAAFGASMQRNPRHP